ncbi:FAD-dependent monooxygenase [Burkholderia oklahomensis]|uniref:FAD binding domain protein n=2 Tax=Burkholderia oklahomensis TaxID=342113 RepID=A0AAI8FMR2_9BURK|nr:FAD-dependent monooxygenase [Burkholderia oklahomensis]AIO66334.1 FAD binding domain protein [Burkholderia oklahomensis]AJX33263.1 FAD dependent oxidoreductase family protein [Burkholderia oklahomensis C6786]MBI0361507.1 FAD-dependent monooxygenase [Burkholderia oklahomensis]QPS37113.1 FAD-dependent monooxygenase [Burkholderia oklahomensis]SUW55535.1 3-(3-hydroxy-phenyl)propionate/3-hydroxycinnamic acid hydroxylase [Burkholderia oklahomensis]
MHTPPRFSYTRPAELDLDEPARVPVVIVGAGLIGLALACDLAQRGVASVVLEARDAPIDGSRAIVFAQRSLEILARMKLGPRLRQQGVNWKVGRLYHQSREVFSFDFQPEPGFEWPPFINVQQSYIEEWLAQACAESGLVDLRSRSRVTDVIGRADGATVAVETPDGDYRLDCDWLIACDGARSTVRKVLDLPFVGEMFPDRFLIVDIEMKDASLRAERRFWFDPPFHPNRSVLLHKQPDNLWRVDFQLGADADPVLEREPERVEQRLRAMFGDEAAFRIDWVSVYTFRCRRLARFVHSRIAFAGDSAHEVSPFGGRGGNGGLQDIDNLGWRLAAIVRHGAPASLIDSYGEERAFAADENILNSTRSARFISPESPAVDVLRRAALALARTTPFGRALVNSGRLSRPAVLTGVGQFAGAVAHPGVLKPGSPAVDAPVKRAGEPDWLLAHLGGPGYTLLVYGDPDDPAISALAAAPRAALLDIVVASPTRPAREHDAPGCSTLWDHEGFVALRYGLAPGNAVLLRPDQHVLGSFERVDSSALRTILDRAVGAPVPLWFEETQS